MAIRTRIITDAVSTEANKNHFADRISGLLNNGFKLHGATSLIFNTAKKRLEAGQSVGRMDNGAWEGFIGARDLPSLTPETKTEFLLLTGNVSLSFHQADFSRLVSRHLAQNYTLPENGSPAIAFDKSTGNVMAIQALLHTGTLVNPDYKTEYELVLGKDDSALCAAVEKAVNEGADTYGHHLHICGGHNVVAGHAVLRTLKI